MAVFTKLRSVMQGRVCMQLIAFVDGQVINILGRNCLPGNLKQQKILSSCGFHTNSRTRLAEYDYITKHCSVRTLKTNASENIDPESGMPLFHQKKGVLVYTGGMARNVKGLKMLSLSTSLLALLAQPFVLSAAKEDLVFKAGLMGTISAVVFFTPALVHFVTKKYVSDIYFNEETKVFTLAYRSFFLRRREWEYKAEDVEIPFAPRMFTTHLIRNKAFFIVAEDFRGKEIYRHMIGFDKPMDITGGSKPKKMAEKKKKKFGLFEDEEDKEKLQKVEKKETPIMSRQLMYDDDDDKDNAVKQKQNNKMR